MSNFHCGQDKDISAILRRLPSWAQIIAVYSVIAIIIYTWTLFWFFWKVPSWLFFLHAGEILTALAYSLTVNFAESLVVLCGPLFLSLVLPRRWFHDVFMARGTAFSIAGLGYLILLANQFTDKNAYPTLWLQAWTVLLAAIIIAALAYLGGRIALLRKILEVVADRFSIFAYILVPLSMVSLLVVLFRSVAG